MNTSYASNGGVVCPFISYSSLIDVIFAKENYEDVKDVVYIYKKKIYILPDDYLCYYNSDLTNVGNSAIELRRNMKSVQDSNVTHEKVCI